jgi:hypothetical protein
MGDNSATPNFTIRGKIPMLMLSPDNQVRRAIRKIGGPTKAACLLNVSGSCIHRWIANGYIPNIDHARKLATESGVSSDLLRRVA